MQHGSHCIQTTFQSLPKEGRREKKSQLFAFLCLMTFFWEKLKLTIVQLKTQLEVQQNEKYRLQCGMYNFISRLLLFVSCCFGSAPLLERMNNKMDRKHWKKEKKLKNKIKKKGTQDRLVCRFDQNRLYHHTSPNILEKA